MPDKFFLEFFFLNLIQIRSEVVKNKGDNYTGASIIFINDVTRI